MTREAGSSEVLYDGGCPRCRRAVAWAIPRSGSSMEFIDATRCSDDQLALRGVDRSTVARSVVVVDPTRGVATETLAVARVFERCGSRWRRVGALLGTRPARLALDPVYRLFTQLRSRDRRDADGSAGARSTR